MKIALVSSLFSPFQLETARALNALDDLQYDVLFSLPFREARGAHWQQGDFSDLKDRYAVAPSGMAPAAVRDWLTAQLHARAPDVVISGALHGAIYGSVRSYARSTGTPWGIWLEQPDPRRHWLRKLLVRGVVRARLPSARFVLAIGDRAARYYGGVNPRVRVVPYGQDLSACLRSSRKRSDGPLTFVYSGQLLPRQNIGLIMEAAIQVLRRRGPVFNLLIAAKGPEQRVIDAALRSEPGLLPIVAYDRDFATWEDRIRPLARADVLLYPSLHSGWGLVIPEAMACGCKVVATSDVEAARYFVRHGHNGVLIEARLEALVQEMERSLDDRVGTIALGEQARIDSSAGDAPTVAQLVRSSIDDLL